MSLTAPVRVAHEGDLGVLTFDDGKVNALNAVSLPALLAGLDALRDAAAVLVLGRPGVFSAGLDLKALPGLDLDARTEVVQQFADLALRLYTWPRPVVFGLTGHTLAGGAVLAATGDARVLGDGPFAVGFTEVAVGIPLPDFVIELGREVLPASAATELLLHGRRCSPAEAAARGFVEVVPNAELDVLARKRAEELGKLPRLAYADTKERMRAPLAARWRESLRRDVPALVELVGRAKVGR